MHDTGGNIGAGQRLAGHFTPVITASYYLGQDLDFLTESVHALRLMAPGPPAEHTASTWGLKLVASSTSSTTRSTRKGQS